MQDLVQEGDARHLVTSYLPPFLRGLTGSRPATQCDRDVLEIWDISGQLLFREYILRIDDARYRVRTAADRRLADPILSFEEEPIPVDFSLLVETAFTAADTLDLEPLSPRILAYTSSRLGIRCRRKSDSIEVVLDLIELFEVPFQAQASGSDLLIAHSLVKEIEDLAAQEAARASTYAEVFASYTVKDPWTVANVIEGPKILTVKPVVQTAPNTCAAAVGQMLLSYHGIDGYSQDEIALEMNVQQLGALPVDQVKAFAKLAPNLRASLDFNPQPESVRAEVYSGRRPVKEGLDDHARLINGWCAERIPAQAVDEIWLHIINPAPNAIDCQATTRWVKWGWSHRSNIITLGP